MDPVVHHIEEEVKKASLPSAQPYLVKIPNFLREVNPRAYEPDVISIGPFHRGKTHLKAMETQKKRYLHELLERKYELSVSRCVEEMRSMEQRARACYDESIDMSTDEFVEMLVLDGCFVVEYVRRKYIQSYHSIDDLSRTASVWLALKKDMLLVENQLPFFVLSKLFDLTSMPNENNFVEMILHSFDYALPGSAARSETQIPENDIEHILGLLHDNWLPSRDGMSAYRNMIEASQRTFVRCATELKEAGIKFEKVEGSNLFDIKFENGVLKIPELTIEDGTEMQFRNLIAYEQISICQPHHVVDYVGFVDSLINSEKDVSLLCRYGILVNYMGDDEMVATMFNNLGTNVTYYDKNIYSEIVNKVNAHCKRQCNVWMAKLRHEYFNTPWALISVLAAAMLLLLTATQTACSILECNKHNNGNRD